MNRNAEIIVTGGLGFIGSNLIEGLNKLGYTNIFIVEDLENEHELAAQNVSGLKFNDIVDIRDCKDGYFFYDRFVFHLGADSSTSISLKRALQWNRRWDYTISRVPFKRLVFASSASIYGNGQAENPLNNYALAKLMSERFFTGKNAVCARLFNVYGPREFHKKDMMSFPSRLLKTAIENQDVGLLTETVYLGDISRDFVYIGDVVDGLINFMLDDQYTGRVLDVGSGNSASFRDVADISVEVAGEYGIDLQVCERPFKNSHLDTPGYQKYSRANYSPVGTNLNDGIRKLWKYYESELKIEE